MSFRSIVGRRPARLFAGLGLLGMSLSPLAATATTTVHATGVGAKSPLCGRLGHSIGLSSGANMFCLGPVISGPGGRLLSRQTSSLSWGSNVDAGNPQEDHSLSGLQAYGQSETSVARAGQYVVEEWNDATGFFTPCGAPMYKEELSGWGFSSNGGLSFSDMGGTPNNCASGYRDEGDPSVGTYTNSTGTYFYMTSLYVNTVTFTKPNYIGLNACKVSGASISCNKTQPAAQSTSCPMDVNYGENVCTFLDKDFLAVDPARGRLYITYTEFAQTSDCSPANLCNGQIELVVCDISGSNAAHPVCAQASNPNGAAAPYFVVRSGQTCENEGAYPAVDVATGDVYVAWEYNWASNNLGDFSCIITPNQERIARVPFSCLTLTAKSSCSGPSTANALNMDSMDVAFVPGYNRTPTPGNAGPNDFPRIAVSNPFGTVSIVWNDTRYNPSGDILMQSFNLGSLSKVQATPVVLDNRANNMDFGWRLLPGLRNANADGTLSVSWYDSRPNKFSTIYPEPADFNVYAAFRVSPRATTTPSPNSLVTTLPTDWSEVSSDIIPNFGDYTDSYISDNGCIDNIAWSDGRLGDPQPFYAGLNPCGAGS